MVRLAPGLRNSPGVLTYDRSDHTGPGATIGPRPILSQREPSQVLGARASQHARQMQQQDIVANQRAAAMTMQTVQLLAMMQQQQQRWTTTTTTSSSSAMRLSDIHELAVDDGPAASGGAIFSQNLLP